MIRIRNILVLALLLSTGALQAQHALRPISDKSAEERARLMTDRMTERLSLTDAQQSEIYLLQLALHEGIDEINEGASTTEEKRTALRTLHSATREKVELVLTPTQLELIPADHIHRTRMRGADRGNHLERLKSELDLTESQMEQLKSGFEEQAERSRESMQKLMQEILTEAQLEKLESLKASHSHRKLHHEEKQQ